MANFVRGTLCIQNKTLLTRQLVDISIPDVIVTRFRKFLLIQMFCTFLGKHFGGVAERHPSSAYHSILIEIGGPIVIQFFAFPFGLIKFPNRQILNPNVLSRNIIDPG